MATEPPVVTCIGAGSLGIAIAGRLLSSGVEVTVWNRTDARLEPLTARGARKALTPAVAARASPVVCLCLTDADAVDRVLFGPNGIAEGVLNVQATPLVVDFSTIGPEATTRIAERAQRVANVAWVDAPVTGGPAAAEVGQLTLFCGGDSRHLERAKAVFSPIAKRVIHAGGVGAGQAMKLCNQLLVASELLALAEALALGRVYGLAPQPLVEALQGGMADSEVLRLLGPGMAVPGAARATGRISTMRKDAALVLSAENERRVPGALAQAVSDAYARACEHGLGAEDITTLSRLFDQRNGG